MEFDPPFMLNYKPGLGYAPAAAGPVGGYYNNPGPGFFGKQPMSSLTPSRIINFSFGKKSSRKSSSKSSKKQKINKRMFGSYPLITNKYYFPVRSGPGNTPGGIGGPWFQSGPVNFDNYWAYGKSLKKKKKNNRSRF